VYDSSFNHWNENDENYSLGLCKVLWNERLTKMIFKKKLVEESPRYMDLECWQHIDTYYAKILKFHIWSSFERECTSEISWGIDELCI
jgi:hypothetical protein